MSLFRTHRIFVLAFAVLLQACSSGGEETGTGITPGTGNNVSVGRITAVTAAAPRSAVVGTAPGTAAAISTSFSVAVNGVVFDADVANVELEGAVSTTSALKLGMVVTVKGTINADGVSGTADQILVEEVIKGPIDSIDPATNSLIVLGQIVVVNETTLYEAPLVNLGSLNPAEYVEVSGIVKSAGVIVATRVERENSLSSYKLKGVVSNTTASTFTIGTLTVNYSGVAGLPSGVPADGLLVEVKGSSFSSGVLFATSLEAETLDVEDADQFEIEGFVGAVNGGGASFTVNNVSVQTSGTTEFSAGLITDLVDGVFVEVEGVLQSGVVTATKVEFREGVKLESYVTAKTVDTLTLDGFSGLIVEVNSETEYQGDSITGIDDILLLTHRVAVRGRYDAGANKVIATRIEVEVSTDPQVVLQGPVDLISNPSLSLMGVSVNTSGISSFGGEGVSDATTFFAAVSVGDVVNVEGLLGGGVVTWESIEIED